MGKNSCGGKHAIAIVAKQICGVAWHLGKDAAQLGTGTTQTDGCDACAVASRGAASRSGFGRRDGVKTAEQIPIHPGEILREEFVKSRAYRITASPALTGAVMPFSGPAPNPGLFGPPQNRV